MESDLVSVAVAADMSGVTERTVRRWVSAGHVPAVSAPGGKLVRLADVTAHAALVEPRRSVAGGRPLSVEPSGGASGQVSADLVAIIQRQAEEIGVLRERLRAIEAAPPAAPMPERRATSRWGRVRAALIRALR